MEGYDDTRTETKWAFATKPMVDDTSPSQHLMVGAGVEQAALEAALKLIAAEEAAATEYLEAIRQQLVARRVVTTTAVVAGQVVPEILSAVQPGDLVVMTTNGRTGLPQWFVGSVAEAVIQRSPEPVLVAGSIAVPAEAAKAYGARASCQKGAGRDGGPTAIIGFGTR